ncbi:PIN domain-containing protein [Oxalobacteraceae bacterium OTU3CINTB1]|nr:PIN domain-containing protein [Oxalobacteraceae bacterium OTU3CINTB1]
MIVLFDTNILIDNLQGIKAAEDEILNYDDAAISSITWMEVACRMTDFEKIAFHSFLDAAAIRIIHPDDNIMRRAATIRGHSIFVGPRKVPLLDCIIRATAEAYGRLIITRNPRDFFGPGSNVHMPYELSTDAAGNAIAVNARPPPG